MVRTPLPGHLAEKAKKSKPAELRFAVSREPALSEVEGRLPLHNLVPTQPVAISALSALVVIFFRCIRMLVLVGLVRILFRALLRLRRGMIRTRLRLRTILRRSL